MEIYVDKLPESCIHCTFGIHDDVGGFDRGITCSLPKKDNTCPLKELTNQQLAIGWLQNKGKIQNDNKGVHYFMDNEDWIYREDVYGLFHHSADELYKVFFTSTWTLLEKPQFAYTDWKGAREACVNGKKVTNTKDGSTVILGKRGEDYIIFDEKGLLQIMSDELYDSTEWKVWD